MLADLGLRDGVDGLVVRHVAGDARPLLEEDPVGQFSRRLDFARVVRLGSLFREMDDAESLDDVLFNAGLQYLLIFAWRAFLDSDDVVEGTDLHPAVETVARPGR